jgi:hypothetical protein
MENAKPGRTPGQGIAILSDFDLVEKLLKCKLPRKFKWKLRGKLEAEKTKYARQKKSRSFRTASGDLCCFNKCRNQSTV